MWVCIEYYMLNKWRNLNDKIEIYDVRRKHPANCYLNRWQYSRHMNTWSLENIVNKYTCSRVTFINTYIQLSVQTIVKYKFLHFSWWWMEWFLVDYLDRWLLYYLWFRNWIWYQNQILYESVTSLWWKTMLRGLVCNRNSRMQTKGVSK